MLRAQFIEEGVEVEARETVGDALASLESSGPLPCFPVADLFAGDDPTKNAADVAQSTRDVPEWIIASRSTIVGKNVEGGRFERIIFRPVDVGELVSQIRGNRRRWESN